MFFLLLTFCELQSVITYKCKKKNNVSVIQNISTEFLHFFLIYYLISGERESICVVQALQCDCDSDNKGNLVCFCKMLPTNCPPLVSKFEWRSRQWKPDLQWWVSLLSSNKRSKYSVLSSGENGILCRKELKMRYIWQLRFRPKLIL